MVGVGKTKDGGMFPLKACGLWFLVYSTNPLFPPRTELNVEYNRLEVAPFKDYGAFKIKTRLRGVLLVPSEGVTRVAWIGKVVRELETYVLPSLQFPGEEKTRACILKYEVDVVANALTLHDGHHDYVFHRQTPVAEKETLWRLLFTQLLVNEIMKQL